MYFSFSNPVSLIKKISICILSTLLLFCGFYLNMWKVADQQWFVLHQRDMESYVIGRLVKSRQDGILSGGGMTGLGSPDTNPVRYLDKPFDYQYVAYLYGLGFGAYTPYKSQIGGQAIFFSLMDNLLPLSPLLKLQLFRIFTSLLSALVLTMIILWFFLEFGLTVAVFVLGSVVFSQWLVVFGRNLWWSIWAFFLPMLVLMYFLRHDRESTGPRLRDFAILVFIAALIKCLINGYEYITTSLIMMMVPVVYYCILDRHTIRALITSTLVAVLSSCMAVFLTFLILCCQIAAIESNILGGLRHIKYSLIKRTHADARDFPPEMTEVFESKITFVVKKYLDGTFFDVNNYIDSSSPFVTSNLFKLSYFYLIVLFLLVSIFLFLFNKRFISAREQHSTVALICATWFSILAPLSWYVIFKAHSYIHLHMNYIVWQMPFTIFGFALCGLAIQSLFIVVLRALGHSS